MDHLGNNTFYIVVIITFICLLAIAIANTIYFADIYNTGSENLSSTQSQQLTFLNVILVILCIFGIIMIGYMIYKPYERAVENMSLNEILNERNKEYDLKVIEADVIKDEIIKKLKVREEMNKIIKKMEIPKKKLAKENSSLQNEITKLLDELKELKEHVGELYDEKGNLIKTNEQLIAELAKHKILIDDSDKNPELMKALEKAKENQDSIFYQGITNDEIINGIEDTNNETHNSVSEDNLSNTFNMDKLYPEGSSLTDILDEIPRSSILTNPHNERKYNYSVNVKGNDVQERRNRPVYIPFSQRKETDENRTEKSSRNLELTSFSRTNSLESRSRYIPYNSSFLNQLQLSRN